MEYNLGKNFISSASQYDVEELERKISESCLTMKKISVDTGKSIEWLEDYFYNGLTGVDIKFYNLVNKKYELNLSLYPEKPHVHKREN